MARVFISHAKEDGECADQVRQWLGAEGHEVFLDRDPRDGIAVGEEWEQRLHERLRWADAVVCVVTSAAVASPWCSAEIGSALSRGGQLLPVLTEPGVDHPLLRSVQHADLTTDPTKARAELVEALRRVDDAWPDNQSPFPGLRPFEVEHHRVFRGRNRETKELAELLRSPAEQAKAAVLLVVGPSGCGKSSLVRAGVLHAMAKEQGWRTLPPILPGADPVAALARELTVAAQHNGLSWTVDHVHHQLTTRGLVAVADELLLANPDGPLRRLLIVVDQFEELLIQTGSADRARFAELLRPALSGPVQVRLWDIRDPRRPSPLGTLTDHRQSVRAVAFSPDGRTLASGSNDTTVRLWDVSDLHQPHLLGTLPPGHTQGVRSVAFSPDGHTLATASADTTVRLWDVSDLHQPHLLGILTGHNTVVNSVVFSSDGHTLVTASNDNTAKLWETNVDDVIARICSGTPAITTREWDQYVPGLPYQPPCP